MIAAIPTQYRSIQFRSRLEARWAAFFDSLGWPYEYEPFDLKGYIPDFVLLFKEPLLVEVKPALSFAELREHTGKLEASGWDKEALLVGARLFELPHDTGLAIGLLADRIWFPESWAWDAGQFFRCGTKYASREGVSKGSCGLVSICSQTHSWQCRCSGCYDGSYFVGEVDPLDLRRRWAQAGNAVQWRAPR